MFMIKILKWYDNKYQFAIASSITAEALDIQLRNSREHYVKNKVDRKVTWITDY